MHRIPGRILLITAAFVLLLVPVAAIGTNGTFDDVPDTHMFYNDIEWLASTGVTKGCNVGGTEFCPEDSVTRGEMAAFLHRLSDEVVDAKTALSAATAADADLLDGIDSGAFLPDGTPPVGATARGNYTIISDSPRSTDNLNWGFELPNSPTVHFLTMGSPPTTECPGTSTDPQATEGHLCVYEHSSQNAENQYVFSGGTGGAKADTFGASVIASNTGTGEFHSFGTWAVTVGAS